MEATIESQIKDAVDAEFLHHLTVGDHQILLDRIEELASSVEAYRLELSSLKSVVKNALA